MKYVTPEIEVLCLNVQNVLTESIELPEEEI